MKNLLSFSIIIVLATAFSIGCKQDSVSTGGLNPNAPVHKIQQPSAVSSTPAAGVAAKTQNHKAATPQSVEHYTTHLIDVLSPKVYSDLSNNPTHIGCTTWYYIFNADLDVTVDPSGQWHMTVSNFKALDYNNYNGNLNITYGNTPNGTFDSAVVDVQEPTGNDYGTSRVLYTGSGHWLENGGHYEGGQKDRVSVTLTDVWNSANHFTFELHFTRSASGEFTCEADMCD